MKSILITIAAALSFYGVNAQNTYDLNLKKGDSFEFTSNLEQNMTQVVMGMESKVDITSVFTSSIKVKETSSSETVLTQTYEAVKMSMKSEMAGIDMKMDSEDKSTDQSLSGIVGKTIDVTVNNAGEVTSIVGLDRVEDEFSKSAEMGGQLSQWLTEEAVSNTYENMFMAVNGSEYSEGMTWSLDDESDNGAKTKFSYSAKKATKKEFEFGFSSKMNIEETTEQQGMEMEIEMEGNFKGSGKMNPKTGLIQEYQMNGTMDGETKIEKNEQMPMDMTIPMTIVQSSSFTLK